MNSMGLPPPPRFRTWKGSALRLSMVYSSAGISTSMFLDGPEGRLVLECGDGAVRDMIEVERSLRGDGSVHLPADRKVLGNAPVGIFVSHPHYDHFSGLLTMLNFLQLLGRSSPLPVIYPKGGDAVEAMVDMFADTLWEEPLFDIDLLPLSGGDEIPVGGMKVSVIDVPHRNSRPGAVGGPVPALACSIVFGNERIAYSGDTSGAPELEGLFMDADLGIVEATYKGPEHDHEGVHMTLGRAMRLAELSREGWLIHFTTASFDEYCRLGP